MDISIRIFMDADDFVGLLEHASSLGASVHYEPRLGSQFVRLEPGAPLSEELTRMLRSPLLRGSPHLLYLGVGDTASDPKAMEGQKKIAAYFGGFDDRALYVSSISVRSADAATLAIMRRLKKWLLAVSKLGIEVVGSPGGARKPVADVHYTEGATRAAREGLALGQRGVANVRYDLPSGPGSCMLETDLEISLRARYTSHRVEADLWFCPSATDLARTRIRPDIRCVPWDHEPIEDASAVVLGDFSKEQTELPRALSLSPALKYLQVPQHLAAELREIHLRNLSGELRINGEGVADLRAVTEARGVTELGGYKITPRFNGASFPALRGLSTWEKNPTQRQQLFGELATLQGLFLAAYPRVLAEVPVSLGTLHLLWGPIPNLDGLSRLTNLEWLLIDRVTKLTSLDGLQRHPTLQKLDLTHCAALTDVGAIAECPSLRSVSVNYCKSLGKDLDGLRDVLERRGGALHVDGA